MHSYMFYFVLLFFCGAVGFDIKYRKIPNAYIIFGFLAFVLQSQAGHPQLDLLLATILLFPFYLVKVVGAGDVKLLLVLSYGIGASRAIELFIDSMFITAAAYLILTLFLRIMNENIKIQNYPYSVSLLAAYCIQIAIEGWVL